MSTQSSIDENEVVFDRRGFRNALGTFPTGVTVVSTLNERGAFIGLTANSFSSVSLDPPLVLFSLARHSPSLESFRRSGVFAVSVLASDQGALSNRFATSSDAKWQDVDYVMGSDCRCPLIPGALASFECRTHALYDGGDHTILVGYVLRFERLVVGEPLIFCRGSYRTLRPDTEFPDYAATGEPKVSPPLNGFDPWTAG